MTLELKDYLTLMAQKGVKGDEAEKHYNRIQRMMQKFDAVAENGKLGRFGPVDVRQDICWWDFGLLRLYQRNVLLMSEKTVEADLMKSFFNVGSTMIRDSTLSIQISIVFLLL